MPLATGLFSHAGSTMPRFREAGDLTLDRLHRDGRVDDRGLGLHPREFALLWRLAARPGERLTGQQWCVEAWHALPAPHSDRLAAHVMRLRDKLAPVALAHLIAIDAHGRYYIDAPLGRSSSGIAAT